MSKKRSVELPKCRRCGTVRPATMISGHDPLAKPGERYKNAYCTRITQCDSEEARAQLAELIKHVR